MRDHVASCRECAYWKRDDSSEGQRYGECRRYAPRPIQHEGLGAWWPRTADDDGCGEGE